MKFLWVNGRTLRHEAFCAMCCKPLGETYLRELTSRLYYYCNHKCYLAHYKGPFRGLSERARAS